MIDFTTSQPLKEAVDSLSARTPVGSAMRSAEWAGVPVEVRKRAFFMATVENERILAIAKAKISQRINLERSKLADGGEGVTMDRSRFIAEMQDELEAVGYRLDPALKGGLRDISSHKRLALVWDMQLAMAEGYAAHKAATADADVLDDYPAYELVRGADRENERDWPEIWAAAGGSFYGEPSEDYPAAPGRMIALVTDRIWTWISDFNVPWPPFKWGSGMILRRLRRRVAEELQVIGPDDIMEVPPEKGFNEGLKASIHGLPQVSQDRMRSELGDTAKFDGEDDKIEYHEGSEGNEEELTDTGTELDRRAFEIAERGRAEILGLRSEDRGDIESSGIQEELLASTAAVAVGRKQLYHEGWPRAAEFLAKLIRSWLPGNVEVHVRDGHVYAWRPDLLDLSAEAIHALSSGDEPRNGRLLGYGQDLFVDPFATVTILDQDGKTVGGFQAPAAEARSYARMRVRDFTAAWGKRFSVRINGKEVAL